jgi:predicted DNA-binding protein
MRDRGGADAFDGATTEALNGAAKKTVLAFVVAVTTATSVRLPETLRERVRARAQIERRTFSNTLRVLVEAGLAATSAAELAELDRLEAIYREAVGE